MTGSPENMASLPEQETSEEEEIIQLKQSLPKEECYGVTMYLYQGSWIPRLHTLIAFQRHFQAHDTDIIIASCRKTGTTWLKALIFAICNRENHTFSASPLQDHNPHELVPQFESNIYRNSKSPDLSTLNPRLFGTHIPITLLPRSIKDDSKCKIVYICRNPLDTLVSSWLFYQRVEGNTLKPDMLDLYIDMFCEGKIPFGPFDEHVSGYWKTSLEKPDKLLFVKYEDLKADPAGQIARIAEFVDLPFSAEEEAGGVVDDIVKLCSLSKLKEVADPSRSPRVYPELSNETLFRKGVVGDWVNHLSPSQAQRFNKIMGEKFSGLGFNY